MERRELGRSGLAVSRVIFGSMPLSAAAREPRGRIAVIQAAIDAGMSIDTAPLYDYGEVEERVGQALAGRRARAQVLTKLGLRWDDPRGPVHYRFRDAAGREQAVRRNSRPDSLRLEVERSLKRLGVETLDLVQLHQPDPDTPVAETMGALAELRRAGKLRAIGVSNFSAAQLREAQAALGGLPLASNQLDYSLLQRGIEAEALPGARAAGIGVLAYSPLARGLLAGAARADTPAAVSVAIEAALRPVAAARGATLAQAALAWLLAQPGVTAVIAGASSVGQLERNAAAAALRLHDDELASIRRVFEGLRLDSYAGQGVATVVAAGARRLAGRIWRRLAGR